MTSQELSNYILDLQMRMTYQYEDKILNPSRYGKFHYAESYKNKALIQNQLLKALWRFDLTESQSESCLSEDQVCKIISFLDQQIYLPRLAPDRPITTTFKDECFTVSFDLASCNCSKSCFSDYEDIRIALYTADQDQVGLYLDSKEEIIHHDGSIIGIVVYNTITTRGDQVLYLKVEGMQNNEWITLADEVEMTMLKDDLGITCTTFTPKQPNVTILESEGEN